MMVGFAIRNKPKYCHAIGLIWSLTIADPVVMRIGYGLSAVHFECMKINCVDIHCG